MSENRKQNRLRSQTMAEAVAEARERYRLIGEYGINAFSESTGLASLDALLDGQIEPERLIVLSARPGGGKSAAAAQIALNIAGRGRGVAIWSGEMSAVGIVNRLAAQVARLSTTEIRRSARARGLDPDEEKKLFAAFDYLESLPIRIIQQKATVEEIAVEFTRMYKEFRSEGIEPGASFVDHIGLVSRNPRQSTTDAIGHITGILKQHALAQQIPVIALSQLRRANVNEQREPILADLRSSGDIEQDADTVLFFHRPIDHVSDFVKYELEHNPDLRRHYVPFGDNDDLVLVIAAKCRDAATGMTLLRWVPEQVRFADADEYGDALWAPYKAPEPYTDRETEARKELRSLRELVKN